VILHSLTDEISLVAWDCKHVVAEIDEEELNNGCMGPRIEGLIQLHIAIVAVQHVEFHIEVLGSCLHNVGIAPFATLDTCRQSGIKHRIPGSHPSKEQIHTLSAREGSLRKRRWMPSRKHAQLTSFIPVQKLEARLPCLKVFQHVSHVVAVLHVDIIDFSIGTNDAFI